MWWPATVGNKQERAWRTPPGSSGGRGEAEGYRILKWYEDHGVSASKGDEERVAYQQLLIDSNQRQFQAVLCWSTNRFTRCHPHEAAEGKKILVRGHAPMKRYGV